MRRREEEWLEELITYSVSRANVLPLTSRCNTRCRFCSHLGNPPGFRLPFMPDLSWEKAVSLLEFLDREQKIVIGESATRIPEGEPLLFPDLIPLLQVLRRRFPFTAIQLTTNGIGLTAEMAAAMAELPPLEVVVSLNSSTAEGRWVLMGDREPGRAISGVEVLARQGVPFHGSIVVMPDLVGWGDVEQTLGFLEGQGCQTVRLMMPGYTDWGKARGQAGGFSLEEWFQIRPRVEEMRSRFCLPIIMEPAVLADEDLNPRRVLAARVDGVIKGSPAWEAGIRGGDEVLRVEGQAVFSRVDGFEMIKKAANPRVEIARSSAAAYQAVINKVPGQSSGLVMSYDADPRLIQRIKNTGSAGPSLVLTSTLAYPVLSTALAAVQVEGIHLQVAPNRLLGGNIGCAGLLTVNDLMEGYREFKRRNPRQELRQVIVPEIAFDHRGEDLIGRSCREMQSEAGIPVRLM